MKNKTFTATLLPLNQLNGNGRIYQDNENLRESIADFNKRVNDTGVAYGELGYPDTFETYLSNVSHMVKNVRIEDDKVVGDITLINTYNGKTLQELFKYDNHGIVFRPRAAGKTNADGTVTIQKIFSYDAIFESSDSFGDVRFISSRAYGDVEHKIAGRIVSDIDPYGEENWDER